MRRETHIAPRGGEQKDSSDAGHGGAKRFCSIEISCDQLGTR
jgi:hypothetical protein